MNLNELLLNAYKTSQKSGNSTDQSGRDAKEKIPSNVKSFVPLRITKIQSFAKDVQDESDKRDEKKSVFQAKPLFQVVNQKVSEIFDLGKKSSEKTASENRLAGSIINEQGSDFESGSERKNTTSGGIVNNQVFGGLNRNPALNAQHAKNSMGIVKIPEVELPSPKEDSVFRRVAKFLMIIGIDEAAKILPHLSAEQTEKIIPEIASIQRVDPDEAHVILNEFQGLLDKSRESGGLETARTILEKAYGTDKAKQMLEKAAPFAMSKPFEYLNDADPERISLLLNNENEGIQALVLSHLDPKKAAGVLNLMENERKSLVVRRLAKMERVSPEILKRIDKTLHEKSLAQTSEKAENIDGRNVLAQILKRMDPGSEKGILSSLAQNDPDLGNDLRQRLFTFDDVIQGDDRFIQEQLRVKDDLEIAKLIAFKDENFRNKILGCISSGRKANVLEEEKLYAPFRRVDCDVVTNDFFTVLRRAYEDGKFFVKNRNDDVYV